MGEREDVLGRYRAWPNLPAMVLERADEFGDKPFLFARRGGEWVSRSYAETAADIRAFARGLAAVGVMPGERVVLVAENRPAWLVADVGVMAAGAVSVPAYITNGEDDHHHILTDSGASTVIVSTAELARRLIPAVDRAPEVRRVIAMEALPQPPASAELLDWDEVLARGRAGANGSGLPEAGAALARGDLACLIYTSGTGGLPKGVMLSHGAILTNCMSACDLIWELTGADMTGERFLSFLPLSHAYEHSAGMFFPASIGAEIWYAESIEALVRNMLEVKPTIMTAVPRLYESMHGRIMSGLRTQTPFKRRLFEKTIALGRKAYEAPEKMGLLERIENRLLDRMVRDRVKERFGGRIKAFVSGGAPLNYEVGVFFTALGLRILQGYGQTESAPVVACNRVRRPKLETVGPPLAGVEVRIAEDGEILVRGENVMLGYWDDPEKTAETVVDGWLHTGDIGEIDADGYIRITDRKKDIIKLSGGDTLSPQRIEGFLLLEPQIRQAMATGDRRPYVAALIVPEETAAAEWAKENGKAADLAELCVDRAFKDWIGGAVARANAKLQPAERVRRFALVAEPFTQENSLMTPTLKVRRHAVRERYGDLVDNLY